MSIDLPFLPSRDPQKDNRIEIRPKRRGIRSKDPIPEQINPNISHEMSEMPASRDEIKQEPKRRGIPTKNFSKDPIPESLNPNVLSGDKTHQDYQPPSPKRRGMLPKSVPKDFLEEHILPEISAKETNYKAKPLPALPSSSDVFIPFLPGPIDRSVPGLTSTPTAIEPPPSEEILAFFRNEEHFNVYNDLFGVRGIDGQIINAEEVITIYHRMARFARASDVSVDVMVENLKLGKMVASEIASQDFHLNTKEYSAKELIAFDWFLRSQQAKMNQLYLKGTMKIPDPDHRIAQFILQVRGQNHGKEALNRGPYPRLSSHIPEEYDSIRNNVIVCPNGKIICFSKPNRDSLYSKRSIDVSQVNFFDGVALGIDASGNDLHPPGKDSETYLFQLFSEIDERSLNEIPVVIIKNESSSVAPIDKEHTWGKPTDLAKAKVGHGLKLYKKFVPSNLAKPFRSLKEDKLPPTICSFLEGVEIIKGEKGTELRDSYDLLIESTKLRNDCSILLLKNHLALQLKLIDLLPNTQKRKMVDVLRAIEVVYEKSRDIQENSKYILLPRGQESILPPLPQMLANKVQFFF